MKKSKVRTSRPATPWYRKGLQFQCTQCGKCCGGEPGYIWMTPAEIRAVAEALGLHVLDFCSMYVAEYPQGFSLREMDNGDCCLLQGGRCSVYDVRPLQCRTWPFWRSNLSSQAAWAEAGRRCPGIGHGRLWTPTEIAAQRDRKDV